MLNSIMLLLAALVSESASWDPASVHAAPLQAPTTAGLPQEPSTLVLALIGIGILGGYAAVQRWRRPRLPAAQADTLVSSRRSSSEEIRRGAA
jgi:hypothetical protein